MALNLACLIWSFDFIRLSENLTGVFNMGSYEALKAKGIYITKTKLCLSVTVSRPNLQTEPNFQGAHNLTL